MATKNGAAAPTTVDSEDIQPLTVEESKFIVALRAGQLAEFLSKRNGSIPALKPTKQKSHRGRRNGDRQPQP